MDPVLKNGSGKIEDGPLLTSYKYGFNNSTKIGVPKTKNSETLLIFDHYIIGVC